MPHTPLRCLRPAGAGLDGEYGRRQIMGERALQNRIIKLQELEAQKDRLEKEAEKIRQEI